MIIERFSQEKIDAVGERFRTKGRMLPEGVTYLTSWMEETGERCFQIMEACHSDQLGVWIACWDDLVEFEVIPVETSDEYWAKRPTSRHKTS
jgi:hypothetical protein